MVLKIRLARFGRRHMPFYNIVVAHARTARNSKPLEVLGTYDPIPKRNTADSAARKYKDIALDLDRARYWLGVGAQPSDPMWRLLSMAGLMESKHDARRPYVRARREEEDKKAVREGETEAGEAVKADRGEV